MHCNIPRRRGVTFLELLVVVTLMGIFVAIAAARYGKTAIGNVGANTDARRLALDMLHAKRRAISTGDNHFLRFTMSGSSADGYTLYRSGSGGDVAVDSYHAFPTNLAVTTTHSEPEFSFEGQALASYQVTLTGPHRTWKITVVTATGTIQVTEL